MQEQRCKKGMQTAHVGCVREADSDMCIFAGEMYERKLDICGEVRRVEDY